MAHNLMEAGYDLILYNRPSEKAEELAGEGAEVVESYKEVPSSATLSLPCSRTRRR